MVAGRVSPSEMTDQFENTHVCLSRRPTFNASGSTTVAAGKREGGVRGHIDLFYVRLLLSSAIVTVIPPCTPTSSSVHKGWNAAVGDDSSDYGATLYKSRTGYPTQIYTHTHTHLYVLYRRISCTRIYTYE